MSYYQTIYTELVNEELYTLATQMAIEGRLSMVDICKLLSHAWAVDMDNTKTNALKKIYTDFRLSSHSKVMLLEGIVYGDSMHRPDERIGE